MRSLLDLDKAQLVRLDRAIAALALLTPAERLKKSALLQALENEKRELMRCNPEIRIAVRLKTAA